MTGIGGGSDCRRNASQPTDVEGLVLRCPAVHPEREANRVEAGDGVLPGDPDSHPNLTVGAAEREAGQRLIVREVNAGQLDVGRRFGADPSLVGPERRYDRLELSTPADELSGVQCDGVLAGCVQERDAEVGVDGFVGRDGHRDEAAGPEVRRVRRRSQAAGDCRRGRERDPGGGSKERSESHLRRVLEHASAVCWHVVVTIKVVGRLGGAEDVVDANLGRAAALGTEIGAVDVGNQRPLGQLRARPVVLGARAVDLRVRGLAGRLREGAVPIDVLRFSDG